jgi:hypothetical protein
MLSVLAVTMVGVAVAGGSASAEVSVAVTNCDHSSGGGIYPRSANYVRINGNGTAIGAVQLCKSSTSYYWGYVVFYSALPTGYWGAAYLNRYRNGAYVQSYTCDSSGGNGWVQPRQTRCWTPKIYAPNTADTFQVQGVRYAGTHPSGPWNAWGLTAEVH